MHQKALNNIHMAMANLRTAKHKVNLTLSDSGAELSDWQHGKLASVALFINLDIKRLDAILDHEEDYRAKAD